MSTYTDRIPEPGLLTIRKLMRNISAPIRLDQGDVSLDMPESAKSAVARALRDNQTHYMAPAGLPDLRRALAEKVLSRNGVQCRPDDVVVTNGGLQAIHIVCQTLLEPGDEVIVADPEWSPCVTAILATGAIPVRCPLLRGLGWRWNIADVAAAITPRTKAIFVNSPNNPTGGVLTEDDLRALAALAQRHDLWVIADEAYEDLVFEGPRHFSIASISGMQDRTVSVYTFSKSYAMTGLRLGYAVTRSRDVSAALEKLMYYSCLNVCSLTQHAGLGLLQASDNYLDVMRPEIDQRRLHFSNRLSEELSGLFEAARPMAGLYVFARIGTALRTVWKRDEAKYPSLSWWVVELLIREAHVGALPGVEFGPAGEGYVRFCFSREYEDLNAAISRLAHFSDGIMLEAAGGPGLLSEAGA